MKRRTFIAGLASAAAWPVVARAQQPAVPVIGMLSGSSFESFADRMAAFRQGLREIGFIEGRNVAIEYRSADGRYERAPALAADLVRQQVAVIVAIGGGNPMTKAVKTATSTIPIVFAVGAIRSFSGSSRVLAGQLGGHSLDDGAFFTAPNGSCLCPVMPGRKQMEDNHVLSNLDRCNGHLNGTMRVDCRSPGLG